MATPTDALVGHVYLYKLSADDVVAINAARVNHLGPGPRPQDGTAVAAGNALPLLACVVHEDAIDTDVDSIDGQVFLNGTHSIWVQGKAEGTGNGTWAALP